MEELKLNKDHVTVFFGGLFDPPHVGHTLCVQEVLRALPQANVVVSPTPISPESTKSAQKTASFTDRLAMCKLNFSHLSRVLVSDFEINLPPPYYTLFSLKHLKDQGLHNLALLLGEDQFWNLSQWKSPEEIILIARIIVLGRLNNSETNQKLCQESAQEHLTKISLRLPDYRRPQTLSPLILSAKPHLASSTALRKAFAELEMNSEILGSWLLPDVYEYINDKNLYKE